MSDTHYYFADTETTGVDPSATACEIGWIKTDENFKVLEQVESIVDPEQMISPAASGIHGLVWDDCKSYPTLKEFFTEDDPSCHGKLLEAPAVIIGHRIAFDVRFLGPYFKQPPAELCTLRWARKLYPDADNHQLSTLIFALDLPRSEGAHRVMADIWSAYYLCKHICDRTGYTLGQLAKASLAPMEVPVLSFGKHKGTPFREVPKSYLGWMRREMKDLDADIKYTIDTILN